MNDRLGLYFSELGTLPLIAQVTGLDGRSTALDDFFADAIERIRATHAAGNTVIFIGNGGSAAIASHMAIDYTKNGGIRAVAMNDGAALTCLSNDLGYENVFAKQLEMHESISHRPPSAWSAAHIRRATGSGATFRASSTPPLGC